MSFLSRRWRRRVRWTELILLLALLTAFLVLGMSYFLRSYYGQNLTGYRPFDLQREQQIQKKDTAP